MERTLPYPDPGSDSAVLNTRLHRSSLNALLSTFTKLAAMMSPKPKLSKALKSATGQLAAYPPGPEDDEDESWGRWHRKLGPALRAWLQLGQHPVCFRVLIRATGCIFKRTGVRWKGLGRIVKILRSRSDMLTRRDGSPGLEATETFVMHLNVDEPRCIWLLQTCEWVERRMSTRF